MKHFSHKHTLILKERKRIEDCADHIDLQTDYTDHQIVPRCSGCTEQVGFGSFYSCSRDDCEYFLHKLCAELPRKTEHPLHPDHSLTLFARPLRSVTCCCYACKIILKNFIYTCSPCNFYLDVICAFTMESVITISSHEHPLILSRRTVLSICDACGTEHKGNFYTCNTCNNFWLHSDCASLPKILEQTNHHNHQLDLASCIPPQYSMFSYGCGICPNKVGTHNWMYYCHKCRYFAHVNCATSKSEPFMSILLPGRNIKIENCGADVIHLPLEDEFASSVSYFLRSMGIGESKVKHTPRMHYSHEHPLIFVDLKVNTNDESKQKWCGINDKRYNDRLCNACLAPILVAPFYKCIYKCNFILHLSCAELPTKVQHPCHPELILILRFTKFPNVFWCHGCKHLCNGFKYSCVECSYQLDVTCASLPNTIKHKDHPNHILSLKEKFSYECNACHFHNDSQLFAFCCETCDFQIHSSCALLPNTVTHRYDEDHPLILTKLPVEDHSDEYCCDICERQLNPLKWFYHCDICDVSLHAWCVPTFDWRSRIKFGGLLTLADHQHPLISVPVIRGFIQCNDYIRVITEGNLCDICGKDFCYKFNTYGFSPMGFKCLQCDFKIHSICSYRLGFKGRQSNYARRISY